MDAEEYRRLTAVAEQYRKHMLQAAGSNLKLRQFPLARRQYEALRELDFLSDKDIAFVKGRLSLPELALVGLAHKALIASGTQWIFDNTDTAETALDDSPLQGVQSDRRSVCPLVRSQMELIDAAVELACVRSDDVVADLGCGDGRVLVRIAQRVGARCIGFDVNEWCIRRSHAAADRAGVSSLVEVVEHDIVSAAHPRLEAASVVYVYLIPTVVAQLEPLLRAQVEQGKRVIIFCTHAGNRIGDLAPSRTVMNGMLSVFEK